MKMQQKKSQGSGGRLGCVQRTEVIVKMQKRSRVGEGQGGCERRMWGEGIGRVYGGVGGQKNKEFKFL